VDPQSRRENSHRLLTDDQLADYQPWLDNQRRLRALLTELQALSLDIAQADPLAPLTTKIM
jgi:hypothetical protein